MGIASPARATPAAMLTRILVLALLLGITSSSSSFRPNGANGLVSIEKDYTEWLRRMGSFRHSLTKKKPKSNSKKKSKPCSILKVSKKKKFRAFSSVQKAISSMPTVNNCRVVISVGPGTYGEKVEIPATMAYVTLKGAGAERMIIERDDAADRKGLNGKPLGTYASAAFAVDSPHFIAKNITFKNSASLPPSGALRKQSVALRILADKAAFKGGQFIGAQDTLYDHVGWHCFEDSVDFVFGNGLSL